MYKTRQMLQAMALATGAAFLCSGCLAMAVPGLAYSGYKYEHDKNQPAASASSTESEKSTTAQSDKSKSAQSTKTTASSAQKIPDSEIE